MYTLFQHVRRDLILLLLYLVLARLVRQTREPLRARLFLATNLFGVLGLLFLDQHPASFLVRPLPDVVECTGHLLTYGLLVSIEFFLILHLGRKTGWLRRVPVLFPIVLLVAAKGWFPQIAQAMFVGFSFMAFRLSQAAVEFRKKSVKILRYSEFVGFAFFAPTIVLGPISPYGRFVNSLALAPPGPARMLDGFLRMVVGATKYLFLANVFVHTTLGDLLVSGVGNGYFDFGVGCISYYLYLYFNFSGFCDMALGAAAILGIDVAENFNTPLLARNIKDFWNRWHITLSTYMREMVFSPLSMGLARRLGTRWLNFSVILASFVVFILIGLWHGIGWGFFIFGASHGLGVALHQYYTSVLRRRLTHAQLARYDASHAVRAVAVTATFMYVALSFAFFANSFQTMKTILRSLEGFR